MTPAAKVTYLATLFIGLSVGIFFGYKTTMEDLKISGDARSLMAPLVLSDFSQIQYKHADLEHASAALLSYASLLEEMENLKPEKGRKADLAKTYTRLALLQDAAGNEQQSHAYMVKADTWYEASGGQPLPESEMKARLQAFDRRVEEALGPDRSFHEKAG
jgi:hypothetical protein